MPVFIEFGVYDDMKIVTNSQPPKQVGPFSYYNPTYGIDKSGKWYSYEFNRYPESGNGALMMTLQVPEEHHDTFYNFLNN